LSEVNEKLDRLLSWKDTVDNLQDLHPKIDSLLSMKLTVDTMRTAMTEMQEDHHRLGRAIEHQRFSADSRRRCTPFTCKA
ncbi:hypothetical protein HPB47_023622, partial [Ixodes persulcatus]